MNVDLVISLRDIDVQTASVMGKDACAFEWCGADSKRDPDTILFAYEKGTTWETTLVDPAPG
ncbi:MAG: hypothetical protein MI757_16500 [Pirellulales bacterium]|nr:hypothetical protein [Pirellulales bacterium]